MPAENIKWTNQQKRAITARESDILVSASAGTGKTAVLSQRCLDLLADLADPTELAQVLVITFTDAAAGPLEAILRATDVPIVSTDIIGESCSSVVDLPLIAQVADNFFRVVAWYDNENAYSLRCVDLVEYMVAEA